MRSPRPVSGSRPASIIPGRSPTRTTSRPPIRRWPSGSHRGQPRASRASATSSERRRACTRTPPTRRSSSSATAAWWSARRAPGTDSSSRPSSAERWPRSRAKRRPDFRTTHVHDARVNRWRIVLVVGLALLALAVAGCGGDDVASPPETTPPVDTTTPPTSETTTFAIYLLRDGLISPVRRSVAATPAVARAAVEALFAGPTTDESGEELGTAIPEATSLLDLSIADGVATVDLSGACDETGSAESLHGRVAQVVATLTQFPTVERVSFRLDGEPATTIGDQKVDPPIGRRAIEEQTPQI